MITSSTLILNHIPLVLVFNSLAHRSFVPGTRSFEEIRRPFISAGDIEMEVCNFKLALCYFYEQFPNLLNNGTRLYRAQQRCGFIENDGYVKLADGISDIMRQPNCYPLSRPPFVCRKPNKKT